MPGEHGVGPDQRGHFLSRLFAQLLVDRGQGLALAIAQAHRACAVLVQDTVLRHRVRVASQECLVH